VLVAADEQTFGFGESMYCVTAGTKLVRLAENHLILLEVVLVLALETAVAAGRIRRRLNPKARSQDST
jgi:hypothetical protein